MRIIKGLLKLISVLIIGMILVIGAIGGKFLWDGYTVYTEVTEEKTIEEMVESIQSDDTYVSLDEVSPYFGQAIVAVEDHRFYDHDGVDLIGLMRAVLINVVKGDIVQGGSTISQQLAKNMYFSHKQTMLRKVAEMFVTMELEKLYEKHMILELYINIIYFGRGCYGIEEASQKFYDKSASELTKEEAAYLAGLPQAPSVYSEDHVLATRRQQVVLEAMAENPSEN